MTSSCLVVTGPTDRVLFSLLVVLEKFTFSLVLMYYSPAVEVPFNYWENVMAEKDKAVQFTFQEQGLVLEALETHKKVVIRAQKATKNPDIAKCHDISLRLIAQAIAKVV